MTSNISGLYLGLIAIGGSSEKEQSELGADGCPSFAELHLQPEENFILKVEIMAFCSVCCKF